MADVGIIDLGDAAMVEKHGRGLPGVVRTGPKLLLRMPRLQLRPNAAAVVRWVVITNPRHLLHRPTMLNLWM
jgi:hypothetical protein